MDKEKPQVPEGYLGLLMGFVLGRSGESGII